VDLFARTFLPAATDAGLSMPTITRHMALVRRCVAADDAVLMVARCVRPDRPLAGEHLLVLTGRRLVVTHEGRLRRQARLHLDAPVHELSDVRWRRGNDPAADQRRDDQRAIGGPRRDDPAGCLELVATAIDGIRERFRIRTRDDRYGWSVEQTLGYVFRPARPVPEAAPLPADAADLVSVHASNLVRTRS
jgi:hypothetical protein